MKKSFCERKFYSMLLTGTFTTAVIFIMRLSDSMIAGFFLGEAGAAGINAVEPITGVTAFFAIIISFGTAILYSREIGAMRKDRANELFGQGLIVSVALAAITALLLLLSRDTYFRSNGITGEIHTLAAAYYQWIPLNTVLEVMGTYLMQMIYADGNAQCSNLAVGLRIGGNLAASVLLARHLGMPGIILGTIVGNVLGTAASCWHFFRKSNTLRFVWHFSLTDLVQTVRFSIVDAVIYISWAIADFVLIGHISARYSDAGQVTLAVVIRLIEFGIVLDGIGLAIQPLLETFFGEKNDVLIRRLMRTAAKAAVLEGLIANALVFVFARPFCALFGITGGAALLPSVNAVRIVSLGLVFCSAVSLMTSYYMLVDHVALSVGITALKDGVLYTLLPVIGSFIWGETGMWAGFAAAPPAALAISFLFIRLRYGKDRFPYLIDAVYSKTVVVDDLLTPDACSRLSEHVEKALQEHGYPQGTAARASLFMEEIGLTILEKNAGAKKPILIEISLLFDEDSALLIERDSGMIFDITDTDSEIQGLSSYVVSSLMGHHEEKAYLTTTGYNRNVLRFQK